MIGLVTWTTYGTWLAGPARGWIDPGRVLREADLSRLPVPDEEASSQRRRSLKWPPATLGAEQKRLIIMDLHRIAELRRFELHAIAAEETCVRVLLGCDEDRDMQRMVQLIKGALSRMLTVATGDEPASSTGGEALIHHKWWPRQYSFLRIEDEETRQALIELLRDSAGTGATVWTSRNGTV